MKATTNKRRFETLILAVGILMAVFAGINAVWDVDDRSEVPNQFKAIIENDTKTIDTDRDNDQASCQYLKILTIN